MPIFQMDISYEKGVYLLSFFPLWFERHVMSKDKFCKAMQIFTIKCLTSCGYRTILEEIIILGLGVNNADISYDKLELKFGPWIMPFFSSLRAFTTVHQIF